jgi:uncharacterized protein involved in exopolysaccharide biosynthesis
MTEPSEEHDHTKSANEDTVLDLLAAIAGNFKVLLITPILAGALALGATYLVAPVFTAKTVFLPPQQQQSATASALASLGALSGLAGAAGAMKSPGEQYVSLMQSTTVSDRLIDSFKLVEVYGAELRAEARKELASSVRISFGKRDGLITVEVDDKSPQRAADLANRYVEELRRVTSELALSEAQQRRLFFEGQLKDTKARLSAAQQNLQSSGFGSGSLRAEPKAAAEGYARLKAETTAAEVRLQTLRRSLADSAPEIQQQQALVAALRSQVAKLETSIETPVGADYVGKYREFKYEETLFDLFSRQYELARLDESREGALIQVVDAALPPERKSKPRRVFIAIAAGFGAFGLLLIVLAVRRSIRRLASQPGGAEQLRRLKTAWNGR